MAKRIGETLGEEEDEEKEEEEKQTALIESSNPHMGRWGKTQTISPIQSNGKNTNSKSNPVQSA